MTKISSLKLKRNKIQIDTISHWCSQYKKYTKNHTVFPNILIAIFYKYYTYLKYHYNYYVF